MESGSGSQSVHHLSSSDSQLATLKISTYPQIRSYRLQDVLAKCDALKTIHLQVQEAVLDHQIQWAFGKKRIRELIVTGTQLVQIMPDAFQGKLDGGNVWNQLLTLLPSIQA